MRLLKEFTKQEAEKMSVEKLEMWIERLHKKAENLDVDNPDSADRIRDKIAELQGVLKAKKSSGQQNETNYHLDVNLHELRYLIRSTLAEAKKNDKNKKSEKDDKKESSKKKSKKKKTPLEEQESMWDGRRSEKKWYMPRLSDR